MFSKQGFVTVCLVILTALLITGCLAPTPTPVAVTGVTLNPATMTLTVGGATGTLVATVAPANATNKSVTWSSSAPAVATVANGVVTPTTGITPVLFIFPATTTITVTTVGGGFTATCVVTVNPAPVAVTGVTLNQATMTLTVGGATGTLVATVAPANATNQSVTWSSSAPAVATVANGVVTPATAGTTAVIFFPATTTITVTTVGGGFTATCVVTVNPAPVAVTGVTLNQATMTLTVGGATGTLVATVAPANATNQSVTWSSSAPAVATVANGVVTPATAGTTAVIFFPATTTITVTTVGGGFTATCVVTVNPAVAVGNSYGGGIVAYILQPGEFNGVYYYDANVQHGLIAATADQSAGIQWYNGSYVVTGATGTAIGTGKANTSAIVNIQGGGSYAAQLCDDLTEGGNNDWFLPSKDELNKLYINKSAIGGFVGASYWSSSELSADPDLAWYQDFPSGYQDSPYKSNTFCVRAVRAF